MTVNYVIGIGTLVLFVGGLVVASYVLTPYGPKRPFWVQTVAFGFPFVSPGLFALIVLLFS